jgi:hypothetical protein
MQEDRGGRAGVCGLYGLPKIEKFGILMVLLLYSFELSVWGRRVLALNLSNGM